MELNWQNIAIGAVGALSLWWVIHRIRRTFEDRCPQCGCLRQKVTYYMEPGDAPKVHNRPIKLRSRIGDVIAGLCMTMYGEYYLVYKFIECKANPTHVRHVPKDRFVSQMALWLKRHLKPWQLLRSPKIDYLMEMTVCRPTRVAVSLARRRTLHMLDRRDECRDSNESKSCALTHD